MPDTVTKWIELGDRTFQVECSVDPAGPGVQWRAVQVTGQPIPEDEARRIGDELYVRLYVDLQREMMRNELPVMIEPLDEKPAVWRWDERHVPGVFSLVFVAVVVFLVVVFGKGW